MVYFSKKDIPTEARLDIEKLPRDKEHGGVIRDDKFILTSLGRVNDLKMDTNLIQPGDTLVHTHNLDTQPEVFSQADIGALKLLGMPGLLHHTLFNSWDYFDPGFPHPYPFQFGNRIRASRLSVSDFGGIPYSPIRSDCYSFVCDVSKAMFGKSLPDLYAKSINIQKLYTKFRQPEELGFEQIKINNYKPQAGEFILMQVSREIPFHLVLVIGGTTAIHQLAVKSELISVVDALESSFGVYRFITHKDKQQPS